MAVLMGAGSASKRHLNRISKSVFFEGGIRVPLILRGPGIAGGRSTDELVELIDLYPTFLEAGDCEMPKWHDGKSVLPMAHGETDRHRDSVLGEAHIHTMVRTREWKYVTDSSAVTLQLFDLQADPGEQKNLAGHPDYRQVEREMRDLMLRRILGSRFHATDADPALSAHTPVAPAEDAPASGERERGG